MELALEGENFIGIEVTEVLPVGTTTNLRFDGCVIWNGSSRAGFQIQPGLHRSVPAYH